ncbi:hypothetical protein KO02_12530 [Sphingobacterium sp. ML3W]|uniref:hypothetical protein n=1 Tax=Sphingobacterium sp. ML3W TaxID=1538644 RepID=UPI0004F7AE4E|nr:hypothetical protein [Sphingobacterium sp. ML3W]AIM37420.1 hypothetical protein KO02_12530 [Sphingobacterium sp. ML3W]
MDISFEKVPRCLVQNWVLSNLSYYGAYNMLADRVTRISGIKVTRVTIINALSFLLKENPSDQSDLILKESVGLINEQGIESPHYVNEYFKSTPRFRED